jgi:hypothetical protein
MESNMLEKSVVESIPEITIVKKKMGRPKGSKNKRPIRKVAHTVPTKNPQKTDSFAIGVSQQHYWLITSIAEARNISRTDVLGGIIQLFVNNIDTGSASGAK